MLDSGFLLRFRFFGLNSVWGKIQINKMLIGQLRLRVFYDGAMLSLLFCFVLMLDFSLGCEFWKTVARYKPAELMWLLN